MPRDAGPTRSRILSAAQREFFRHGFLRVKMSDVARAAGVTKRTLYHHYDSKDALLEAMLARQAELSAETFRRAFAAGAADPSALVARVFDDLVTWSDSGHFAGSGFTRLAMEQGDLPGHPAMRLARQHKHAVERYLAERLAELGQADPEGTARKVWIVIEGGMLTTLIHRDSGYFAAAREAALAVLAAPSGSVSGVGRP